LRSTIKVFVSQAILALALLAPLLMVLEVSMDLLQPRSSSDH